MKRQTPPQKLQRARARGLQNEFFDAWGSNQSIHKALAITGISWHRIQAWRRWDADFRSMYDSMKTFMDIVRHEDRQDLLFRKAVHGHSDRALELFMRLYGWDHLCPLCQRLYPAPKNVPNSNVR